ncbi:Inosine/uridine-preferring nucleoside hydrolase domain-containing protein [Pisolithus thermaeus]|nr:Inosine/uridine-preferring nucleoside hydrolase domain-containing protein [Pisolithus sp. B1]KAI6166236.1 Inosine/uridine-preferring nucleoside hydrolase domain-containing protein [Pisolithus thermaeus]
MQYVWLDADPGHDDVTAILLAVYLDNIKLLGISTVHGNSSAYWTGVNAARALYAFSAPDHIKVYPGTVKPLTRKAQYAPNIHGEDGLGGVVGLPPPDSPEAQARFALHEDGTSISALEGMVTTIKEIWKNGAGHKVSVVSCGPLTNIALFIVTHPELLEAVEQFVFMGGGIGLGNVTPAAEFNIACDPEAAQIVLDCPVKTVMVPLNVTHTAIVKQSIQTRLCAATVTQETGENDVPVPSTGLRLMLSSLITFFAHTYKEVFGFDYGPPLHDALTVAYVSNPNLFKGKRYRVDVELQGRHTTGETVADIWDYQQCGDSWGAAGKNCLVLESLEVDRFFDVLLGCVDRCDRVSPLNARP